MREHALVDSATTFVFVARRNTVTTFAKIMLEIRDLQKTYAGGVQALRGVSLDAGAGVFGLLGPNGAGKTALMKILATLLALFVGNAAPWWKSGAASYYGWATNS